MLSTPGRGLACIDDSFRHDATVSPVRTFEDAVSWMDERLGAARQGRIVPPSQFKGELEQARKRRMIVALLVDPYTQEFMEVTLPVSLLNADLGYLL